MTPESLDLVVDRLSWAILRPSFLNHQVDEAVNDVMAESFESQPISKQVFENLYGTAFEGGLGNSLYLRKDEAKTYGPMELFDFVSSQCNLGSTVVFGTGIDHDTLVNTVSTHFVDSPLPAPTLKSIFSSADHPDPVGFLTSEEAIQDLKMVMQPSEVDRLQRMLSSNPEEALLNFRNKDLFNFLQAFGPNLIQSAQKMSSDSRASEPSPSQYVGGEFRLAGGSSDAHVALGFNVPTDSTASAYVVAKLLSQQKGSFHQFSDSGLLSVSQQASTSAGDFGTSPTPSSSVVTDLYKAVVSAGKSSKSAVDAAKAAVITDMLSFASGEKGVIPMANLYGYSVFNHRDVSQLDKDLVSDISSVNTKTVGTVVKAMLDKTPSLVAQGKIDDVSRISSLS